MGLEHGNCYRVEIRGGMMKVENNSENRPLKALQWFIILVITVELLGVLVWWTWDTLQEQPEMLLVLAVEYGVILFTALAVIINQRRGKLQTDERIEKYTERSVMLAGIAGLFTVLQFTVVEILIGVSFRAIEILGSTGLAYLVTVAAANAIQNRYG